MKLTKETLCNIPGNMKVLTAFISICYEGLNVGDIVVGDILEGQELVLKYGDIVILPKNEKVIFSIKQGVLRYHLSTGLGAPLVLYTMHPRL